jgi:ATP-dependent DNA helicase RecQ
VLDALQKMFGFSVFRDNQEAVVRALLDRRDAFVVMPTGGGKSLCYQLPAHLLDGVCLVISPLISLMKDQVDAANANGLRAAALNSALDAETQRRVVRDLRAGELDLLYVSPERFALSGFLALLQQVRLSFVAVDEAHCISEWGHDFRPDYLALSTLTETLPGIPVAAFTATATPRVQDDIVARLKLRDPLMVRASFNRPNLFYAVRAKEKPGEQIARFIAERPGEAGIVYRTTRKSVEETATMLQVRGIRALPYHAGLDDLVRANNQEAFNRDEVDVVVATIAFGMGIDKSNVRYVIHGDLPKNIEGYYQETGRSGRDGDPAHCLLLFGAGDIPKQRHFIDRIEDEAEKQRALRALHDVVGYASTIACRRRQLLGYFGEAFATVPCGACDVCTGSVATVDGTRDAQIVLSAMVRTGQRFGINHIIDVVVGADTARLRELGHDQLKTYGIGRDRDKRHWRRVVDHLLAQQIIAQDGGEYPVLVLRAPAGPVLRGEQEVRLAEVKAVAGTRRTGGRGGPALLEVEHHPLFDRLRTLRKEIATELGVPAYVVFSDRTLHEMAARHPRSDMELLSITGVGERKLEQFGARFLALLREEEG